MFARVRSMWLAGGGGTVLAFVMAGAVAGATMLAALSTPSSDPAAPVVDTAATFEDLDGNGVDDDCQTDAVVADPEAAASAEAAADLDGDGTISVSEAAQSDRTGGTNCNHGGYVSQVAHDQCATTDTTEDTTTSDADESGSDEDAESPETQTDADAACAEDDTANETTDADTPPDCQTSPVDEASPALKELTPEDLAPNAHGKAVADVAQSDAVGGKNCNHGGAVSEAAKKDHDAERAARDAAKALRDAERAQRLAERAAARDAKNHGHGHGHGG